MSIKAESYCMEEEHNSKENCFIEHFFPPLKQISVHCDATV